MSVARRRAGPKVARWRRRQERGEPKPHHRNHNHTSVSYRLSHTLLLLSMPEAVPVTKVQEVANPGLHRFRALSSQKAKAAQQSALQAEVEKLAAKVAALEAKLAAPASTEAAQPAAEEGASIGELVASLKALTAAAEAEAPLTSSACIGAGVATSRPTSAPYRTLRGDAASVVSWSADAAGRSKTPGWYHTSRKQLYAQRAKNAAGQPTGCFVSHSKYADEAVRIAATGRLAFSAGK